MLSLPSLWWIVGTVGAAILTFLGSKRLAWHLLLFVPLAGELVIVLYPAPDPKLSFSIHLLAEPMFWVGIGMMYSYGLLMFGGWAILLGEVGWITIWSTSLSNRFSLRILAPAAGVTGGLVGYICLISWHAFDQVYFPSPQVWASTFQEFRADGFSIAGLTGGVLGGILVAYHAVKESPREKPSLAYVQPV
jgi:hypothetical protein